jgi:DNA-binding transcriptional ArsR family regulator
MTLTLVLSTVSHHGKEFYRAGLVRTQPKGQNVEPWIDPEVLKDLASIFTLSFLTRIFRKISESRLIFFPFS